MALPFVDKKNKERNTLFDFCWWTLCDQMSYSNSESGSRHYVLLLFAFRWFPVCFVKVIFGFDIVERNNIVYVNVNDANL